MFRIYIWQYPLVSMRKISKCFYSIFNTVKMAKCEDVLVLDLREDDRSIVVVHSVNTDCDEEAVKDAFENTNNSLNGPKVERVHLNRKDEIAVVKFESEEGM